MLSQLVYSAMLLFVAAQAPADPPAKEPAFEAATRAVAEAVRAAARTRGARGGDALTDDYVRAAARAALRVPKDQRNSAFLRGLSQAIVDPKLGGPTMRGRDDLAKHFLVSAALADVSGPVQAEVVGISKEQFDMAFGSGFSFSDVLADLAGIRFAERLTRGRLDLQTLASDFTVAKHLPDPAALKLRDGLSAKQFQQLYGSLTDQRYLAELRRVRASIDALAPPDGD